MEVIKRSGRRQKFSISKLKRGIERAAKDAKITASKRKSLAMDISSSVVHGLKGKRSIRAAELRRRVLTRIERQARSAASAWRRFDRKRRR